MQFIRERRVAPRIKLFQPVDMRVRDMEVRAHLLNISKTGTLLYARTRAAVGERIHISCEIDLGDARVVWGDGARLGVAFDRPLLDRQIQLLIANQEVMADRFAQRLTNAMELA